MSVSHEDLVLYALGGLDDEEATRIDQAVGRDPARAAELEAVRHHLALHERAPELQPAPALWDGIRARIEEPASARRRYWVPLAAAALVAVALFLPRGSPAPAAIGVLHGNLTLGAGKVWTSDGVSRIRIGTGVTVTLDDATTIVQVTDQRLALRAGRLFLEVSERRHGFTVDAGDVSVETVGTRFFVERRDEKTQVLVEKGTVRCHRASGTVEVAAGGHHGSEGAERPPAGYARAWFGRPTLTARVLDAATLRVVLRNDMPDSIELAPPTAGAPFLWADQLMLAAPEDFTAPIQLRPGEERTFDLRLPDLKDREAFFLRYPRYHLETEVRR